MLIRILVFLILPLMAFSQTARETTISATTETFGGAGASDCGGGGCDNSTDSDADTWEAFTDNNLVGNGGEILSFYNDSTSYNIDILLDDATCDDDEKRILESATGEGHDGTDAVGVNIVNRQATYAVQIDEDFSVVQDMRIRENYSGSTRASVYLTANDTRAIGIIVYDNANSSGATYGLRSTATGGFILCSVDNGDGRGFIGTGGGFVYNSVFTNNVDDGVDCQNGVITVKNTIADNNKASNDYDRHESSAVGRFSASSDGSAANFSSATSMRSSQTFTFTSGTGNITSGDAGANDFGEDLSGDGVHAFSDMIYKGSGNMGGAVSGTDFDTWDIGPYEPDPAAAGGRRRIISVF